MVDAGGKRIDAFADPSRANIAFTNTCKFGFTFRF
jgi:hypothetical protein